MSDEEEQQLTTKFEKSHRRQQLWLEMASDIMPDADDVRLLMRRVGKAVGRERLRGTAAVDHINERDTELVKLYEQYLVMRTLKGL
jgi:hypothetical protein